MLFHWTKTYAFGTPPETGSFRLRNFYESAAPYTSIIGSDGTVLIHKESAGCGNRTRVTSLGSSRIATIRIPQKH